MNAEHARLAEPSDLDALVELEGAAQERPWNREALDEELRHEEARVVVAVGANGVLLAMCIARRIVDELWILQVGTHPSARRQGWAGRLMRMALESDLAQSTTSAWLEVRATNAAAIALYVAESFVEVGMRAGYYPPANGKGPKVDAIIMRRSLGPNSE